MISKLWKKGKSSITAKAKGDALENRVVRLFKKRGEWCVKKDVTLRDNFGNISQIVCILAFYNTLALFDLFCLFHFRQRTSRMDYLEQLLLSAKITLLQYPLKVIGTLKLAFFLIDFLCY